MAPDPKRSCYVKHGSCKATPTGFVTLLACSCACPAIQVPYLADVQKALDRFLIPDARQMVHELSQTTGPSFHKLNDAVSSPSSHLPEPPGALLLMCRRCDRHITCKGSLYSKCLAARYKFAWLPRQCHLFYRIQLAAGLLKTVQPF